MSYFPSQLLLARYAKSNGFTLRKTLHFDKSAIIKGGVFSGIKSVKKKKKKKVLTIKNVQFELTGNVKAISGFSAKFMVPFRCISTDNILGILRYYAK